MAAVLASDCRVRARRPTAAAAVESVDWSATPLGPAADWPDRLKSTLALVLASPAPTYLAWGDELVSFYNDAYAPLLGRKPAAMGRPFAEVWPEAWPQVGRIAEEALVGQASYFEDLPLVLEREGAPEQTWWTFACAPVPLEDGSIGGVYCTVQETTQRVLAQRNSDFQVRLSDQLRGASDPGELLSQVAQWIGEHLLVERVGYGEVDETTRRVTVPRDWTDGTLPSLAGRCFKKGSMGPGLAADLDRGRTVVVEDCDFDPRTSTASSRSAWRTLGVRSLVAVPLVRADRLSGVLYIHGVTPRRWSPAEIAFVEDAAARSWDGLVQARADAALRESEARFRSVADAAPVMIWTADRSKGYTWVNRPWLDFTGRRPEEELGLGWADNVHPDDRDRAIAGFVRALEQKAHFRMDYRLRRADGEWRVVEESAVPHLGPDGTLLGYIGSCVDVTETREAEEVLRGLNDELEARVLARTAERNLLATIMEVTDSFIQVSDLNFRWLAINKASADEFERIFGIRPSVGASMLDLLANRPEHQAAVKAVWSRALAGEEFTEIGEFGDLDRRHYEMRYNVLRDEQGRQIGAFQIVTDVSERVRAERSLSETAEALRQSQKMEALGQLTGGIAHDFNNLLQIVTGNLEMLARHLPQEDPRLARWAEGARYGANRASALTTRLLNFARRQPLQPRAVDANALILGMTDMLSRSLGETVEIKTSLCEAPGLMEVDPNQLESALVNLAVNARDAIAGAGVVTIATEIERLESDTGDPQDYVAIVVEDSGCGMDAKTLSRVFEPFFTTKPAGQGTGLGLAMVSSFVTASDGRIDVDSAPGAGTRVKLLFPHVAALIPDGAFEADTAVPAGRNEKILLVEDNEGVRDYTAEVLRELDYDVTAASEGQLALDILAAGHRFDLLLVDTGLPNGMTGYDFARQAMGLRPDQKVLFTSGHPDRGEAAEENFNAVLRKPFSRLEIADRIRAELDDR